MTSSSASRPPTTSASCTADGCTLAMASLEASTTYVVSCAAEADAGHRSKRMATLLVRTLDPEAPPAAW